MRSALPTNAEKAGWARRYQRALRAHIGRFPGPGLQSADGLGRQAVALGLETLDVARVHQRAMMASAAPGGSSGTRRRRIARAKRFYAETIVPIERTHGAVRESDARVRELSRTLSRRARIASASVRHLQRFVARRQAAEAALRKSGKRRARLREESRRLHGRLRRQTREILTAQEAERRKSSRRLHDEIAQTLVAINVRLLTLREMAAAGAGNLKNEVAGTQRLVEESVRIVSRFAHEIGRPHEA